MATAMRAKLEIPTDPGDLEYLSMGLARAIDLEIGEVVQAYQRGKSAGGKVTVTFSLAETEDEGFHVKVKMAGVKPKESMFIPKPLGQGRLFDEERE